MRDLTARWPGGLLPATGVFLLMGAEAFTYGYSFPYFSLSLHRMGLSAGAIGLNASAAGVGILFLGPFVPRLIERFGLRRVVIAQFSLSVACFAALLGTVPVAVWFVVRFALGAIVASVWTTTEIWLNTVVTDKYRGRVLAVSGTWYACCQFAGPFAVGVAGVANRTAAVTGAVPLAAGVIIAIALRVPASAAEDDERSKPAGRSLATAFQLAPALLLAGFVTGLGESSMEGLLPLYGIGRGLTDGGAARLVAVFSGGEAVLAILLGWLADRFSHRKVITGTLLAGALSAALLPAASFNVTTLWIALFVAGGTISGIYTLAVVMMGAKFRAHTLSIVSVWFAMTYSAGSVAGPTPIGYLMRAYGGWTLPASVAAVFFMSALVTLATPGERDGDPLQHETAAVIPGNKGEQPDA